MAGIIGKLTYQPCATPVVIEDGYVDIRMISGGPSYLVNEQNPDGQWQVNLAFYLSLLDYQTNKDSNVAVNDAAVPQYFMLQNVPHMSPVDAALKTLQAWWPKGTVVP